MATINLNPNKRKQYDLDALLAPDVSDTDSIPADSRVPNSRVPNSRSAYITQYQKDHYDRLTLKVTGGYKELLKSEATKRGVSLTKLVVNALAEYLQNHPV